MLYLITGPPYYNSVLLLLLRNRLIRSFSVKLPMVGVIIRGNSNRYAKRRGLAVGGLEIRLVPGCCWCS